MAERSKCEAKKTVPADLPDAQVAKSVRATNKSNQNKRPLTIVAVTSPTPTVAIAPVPSAKKQKIACTPKRKEKSPVIGIMVKMLQNLAAVVCYQEILNHKSMVTS
jgi:hypothetical protein